MVYICIDFDPEQKLARSKNRRKIENSRKSEKGVVITASETKERGLINVQRYVIKLGWLEM